MGSCRLTLVLDRTDRVYKPGDLISGRVEVESVGQCTCPLLTIGWQSLAYGSGGVALGPAQLEETLFSGRWLASQRLSYAFRLPAPSAPSTIRQAGFTNEWYVVASASLGGLRRTEVCVSFGLSPADGGPVNFPSPMELAPETSKALAQARRGESFMILLASFAFLAFGGFFEFLIGRDLYTGDFKELGNNPLVDVIFIIIFLPFVAAGLAIASNGLRLLVPPRRAPDLLKERFKARRQSWVERLESFLAWLEG